MCAVVWFKDIIGVFPSFHQAGVNWITFWANDQIYQNLRSEANSLLLLQERWGRNVGVLIYIRFLFFVFFFFFFFWILHFVYFTFFLEVILVLFSQYMYINPSNIQEVVSLDYSHDRCTHDNTWPDPIKVPLISINTHARVYTSVISLGLIEPITVWNTCNTKRYVELIEMVILLFLMAMLHNEAGVN